MELKMVDPMTLYVLIGGILVIFVGLGLRQVETLQKTVPLWLWSGLAGILIGAGASAFAVHRVESMRASSQANRESVNLMTGSPPSPPMGGPMGGGGTQPSGGRGGGPGGGAPGGGGPGGGGPRARRDLPALIGKLAILTGGLHLDLDDEQKTKLASAIAAIDKDEEMTEEAAKEHLDAINAILTSENADVLASIDLPRPTRAGGQGGPGGGGPAGGGRSNQQGPGPGGQAGPASTSGAAPVMSMGAGGGGGAAPSNDNPFKQEENAKRLSKLRAQIGQ